jgi:hypothetical protein
VLISQDEERAMVYTRDESGRPGIQSAILLEGAGASIEIPDLGLALPFSALYEGIEFDSDTTSSLGSSTCQEQRTANPNRSAKR